jgi:hypothetical protein
LGNLANAQPFKKVVEKALAFSEQQRFLMAKKCKRQESVLPRLEITAHQVISLRSV